MVLKGRVTHSEFKFIAPFKYFGSALKALNLRGQHCLKENKILCYKSERHKFQLFVFSLLE